VNDSNFDSRVLQSGKPVLVDFGAEWCHPCRKLDPLVEELATEWADRLDVLKLDVDESAQSAMRFGVMSVPSLILFVNGEVKERLIGFQPKTRIQSAIAPHLQN
jgi:thioredoxin 1